MRKFLQNKLYNSIFFIFVLFTSSLYACETSVGELSSSFIKATLEQYGIAEDGFKFEQQKTDSKTFSAKIKANTIVIPFQDNDVAALIAHLPEQQKNQFISYFEHDGIVRDWSDEECKDHQMNAYDAELGLLKALKEEKDWEPLQTLHVWQGSILHEVGHLTHNTSIPSSAKIAYLCGQIAATSYSYSRSGIFSAFCTLLASEGIERGSNFMIRKLNEIQADFFAIEKGKSNPEMLYREAKNHRLLHCSEELYRKNKMKNGSFFERMQAKLFLTLPILEECTDIHPRSSVRAAYFEKAYEKCKEEAVERQPTGMN